jgi:glucose/arabinose dehydrogenase
MTIKLICYSASAFVRKSLIVAFFLSTYWLSAQLPAGYSDELVQLGYNTIMGSVFTEDGSKMFVWEKSGKVYVSNFDGTAYIKQPQPVLDISDEVGDWRDFGFLSFCLDPDFDNNGLVYMFYVVDRHHLLNFGTPDYDPNTNQYFAASISRVTRYQLNLGSSPLTTDYNSRFVLLGESISTGVPLTHESHAGGTILFGDDGTLIVSTGDNASYNSVDQGSANETYYQQAIDDGIMRPEENVGAFRSQQITSLCGKILRLDPNTGDGIPSNPFYEPINPRSPKSRMYAMGFRNPFRMSIQKGSGSSNPADANPGILFVADVGWFSWEDLHVLDKPGLNAGWPLYEGQTTMSNYWNTNTTNPDENNERFKDNCLQPSSFVDNPNPALRRFIHNRPEVAWRHGSSNEARVPWFNGTTPTNPRIGSANSPTTGVEFRGNTGVAGTYIHGIGMGSSMTGKYFFTDYIRNWIHVASLNDGTLNWFNNIDLFAPVGFGQGIVHMAENPLDGFIYYSNIFNGQLRRLTFDGPKWTVEPTDLTLECSSELDINNEFANWLSGFSGTVGCGTANLTNDSEGLQSNCGNTFSEEVTFTLSDGCGNEISKTATFSIVDTSAPTAPTAPEDATYECIDEVPVAAELTATDNCDGDITATGTDSVDTTNPCEVIITRTWTFTDSCNNESSVSQIITVADTTAPAIPTAPEAATYQCLDEVPAAAELTATDNCDGDVTVIGTDSVDNTNPCEVIITRTWTFTDSCNNASSVSQIITVADITAPTAPTAPDAATYECINEVLASAELTATDNCDGDITVIGTDSVDTTNPCEVIITRTWTFTDSCNNESSISQIITVADTTAPQWDNPPNNLNISCSENITEQFVFWLNSFNAIPDNCSNVTQSNDNVDFDLECGETRTVTFTLSDDCGNTNSVSADFTIEATLNLSNFDLTKIRLFPNPTQSQFTVTGLSESSQLTVYTLSGQLIMKQEIENNSILKLNVEAGIYMVKIEQKDKFLVKRLIVN